MHVCSGWMRFRPHTRSLCDVMASDDPFPGFKDEVRTAVGNLQALFERWKELLDTTTTYRNEEFEWTTKEMNNHLTTIEEDLKDMDESILIVERQPAKFKVDAAEIQNRRDFVARTRADVKAIRDAQSNPRAKSKMERDEREHLMRSAAQSKQNSRYQRLQDAVEKDNETLMSDALNQRQQLIARQDNDMQGVSQSVGVLKNIAGEISNELEHQAQMVNELDRDVDNVQNRLKRTVKRLDQLIKTTNDKGSLCAIVVLILVLIIMLVIVVYY